MRAIVYRDFGSPDVLHVEDVSKPSPAVDEVLVAVRAAAVNMFDWYMVHGKPYPVRFLLGRSRLKPLGVDMSGEVEAVGRQTTRFKPGDRVFGLGRDRRGYRGAFAEYVSVPEKAMTLAPRNATFAESAAAVMAGLTALQGLRDHGNLQCGERVLVNGASGGIGTYAVQIAKAMGAFVTGVCSRRNVEMVRSIGADRVIDYTADDFTAGGERYDLILDIVCNHSWSSIRRVLSEKGRYVLCGGPPIRALSRLARAPFTKGRLRPFVARGTVQSLEAIRELMESGAVRSVIDRSYPLEEANDALRYVVAGHTQGKVVLSV